MSLSLWEALLNDNAQQLAVLAATNGVCCPRVLFVSNIVYDFLVEAAKVSEALAWWHRPRVALSAPLPERRIGIVHPDGASSISVYPDPDLESNQVRWEPSE